MSPFEEARRSLGDGPSQARRREQLARLLRTATVQRTHPRWRPPRPRLALVTLGLGLASAGTLITLVALSPAETSSPSTPRPVAGMRLEGSTVPALDFVDGSSVKLEATRTARLDVVDEGRVELTLERGTLAAHVQKDTGRTWRYHVGPWLVVVRGTRLSLRYAPELGELEVSVSEGAVEVTGPGGPARVAQGQTLRRSVDATSRPQGPGLAPPSLGPTPTLAMPHPHSKKLRPAPETRHDAGAPWASASWLELLDLGQRAAALDEAEHQGVWARLELRGPSAPSPRPTRAERTPHTNTSPWGPRLGAPRTRGTRDGPRPRALIHLLLRDDAAMHPEPAAREGLVERPRQRLARHRVHPELDELLRPPRQAGRIEPHDGPLLHHPVVHGEHEDLPRPLQLDASRRVTQQHAHSVRAHGAHPSATGRGWLQCVSERTRS